MFVGPMRFGGLDLGHMIFFTSYRCAVQWQQQNKKNRNKNQNLQTLSMIKVVCRFVNLESLKVVLLRDYHHFILNLLRDSRQGRSHVSLAKSKRAAARIEARFETIIRVEATGYSCRLEPKLLRKAISYPMSFWKTSIAVHGNLSNPHKSNPHRRK